MKRWTVSLASLPILSAAVLAGDPNPLPSTPPPRISIARIVEDGSIELSDMTYELVTMRVPRRVVEENGNVREVTIEEPAPIFRPSQSRVMPEGVQVFTVDGKKVESKDLAGLLKDRRTVLVSADGLPVDPAYLRLAKDDTLVFVSPRLLPSGPLRRVSVGGPTPRLTEKP